MSEMMLATLSNIRTVEDMVIAFRNEERCRHIRSPKACDTASEVHIQKLQPKPALRLAPPECLFHEPYVLALQLPPRLMLQVYGSRFSE
jgi:hypothetical protein